MFYLFDFTKYISCVFALIKATNMVNELQTSILQITSLKKLKQSEGSSGIQCTDYAHANIQCATYMKQ